MMIWILIATVAGLAAALLVQRLRLQRFLLSDLGFGPTAQDRSDAFLAPHDSLFQTRLGRKIFSAEDLPLLNEYPQAIRKNYELRKRAAALNWLGEVRRQMRLLVRAHRRAARGDSLLRPREELALVGNYWLFLAICAVVEAWTLLAGPLSLRRAAERVSICHEIVFGLALKSVGLAERPRPMSL